MKNTLTLLCLSLIVLVKSSAFGQAPALPAQFGPHQWTATVKVIGEDGNPIAGADVSAQYDVPRPAGSAQPTFAEIKGLTDDNGMFSASHTDSSFDLGIVAEKTSYYTTHAGHQFYFTGQVDKKAVIASWNPSFTLMLKKIGNPIPMYAKKIDSITFPAFNKAIGYDLMAGDWVAPYGKGVTIDFLFTENHTNAKTGYTFAINSPNQGDGIQGFTRDWSMGVSGLLSSHEAPIDGYQPQYMQTHMPNRDRIYYFRVRSVLDSQGNILSTHYGKIYGDFMQFTYYLNPAPNNRNIEFNPKHNLLNLSFRDLRVDAP